VLGALSIALVLGLELVNSAIECLIDHLHPEVAPEIKLAKDDIAGAVLIVYLGALCVGVLMILAVLVRCRRRRRAPRHAYAGHFLGNLGAGEGIRTLDPNLGKVVLYP
jgi:hypothetical protein